MSKAKSKSKSRKSGSKRAKSKSHAMTDKNQGAGGRRASFDSSGDSDQM